jgi:cardiolipin synthase (CMP-forming)
MQVKDIPNLLTSMRILLIAPLVYALLEEDYSLALWIIVVAGATDGLDGFLAKHYQWESRIGSILDPIADKLLLISSFVVLAWLEHIPTWLMGLVLGRDVAIVLGGLAYHFLIGPFAMEPALLSKLNTLCQILLVVVVLVDQLSWPAVPKMMIGWLIYLVAFTTSVSGFQYIWYWGGQAWRVSKAQRIGAEPRQQGPEAR